VLLAPLPRSLPSPGLHTRRTLASGSAVPPSHPGLSASGCFTPPLYSVLTTALPLYVLSYPLRTDMPPSTVEPSQDLKYPPVHINHSLEELDLDTLIMRSTSRRLQDEPSSSLDESAFEFLGDSLIETSDDEAHTESIASTDGYTPDDASSFSDDDVDYGTDARELQDSTASLPVEASEQQQHDTRSMHSTGDSTLTEVPIHAGDSGHLPKIRLDEQPGQDAGVSQGSKTIRIYPGESGILFPVFDQYECSEVRLVVKAALSESSISTPDSYKILYIGMPDKWVQDYITSKISAALTACPNTSRSIMVQGQLEPYGPIMHVDRCTDIEILSADNELAHVALTFDNEMQFTFGRGPRSTSEARPDLVVFYHPSAPQSVADAQEYAAARQAFDREQLPYLEMTSSRNYGLGAPSYDSRSLSVCMEGREDPKADYKLKEVLPIDHYTFGDLEPSQVNRHLALISPHMMTAVNKKSRNAQTGKMWKGPTKIFPRTQLGVANMVLMLAVLSAMVLGYVLNPDIRHMLRGRGSFIDAQPVDSVPTLCISPLSVPLSTPLSTPTSVAASTASVASTPRGLTLILPQAKSPKQAKRKLEKSVHFEIQPSEDHQFKLIPNKDMLNARKKPQLQVQVTREAQAVPIRYNRTISGIYVVDLEQRYPFGRFNISIASLSKPLLQQSFEIALGHNQTMFDQLLESTTWNFANTQSTLVNFTTKAAHGISAGMTDLETTARLLTKEIQQSSSYVEAQLRSATGFVGRQLSTGAGIVKNAPEVAWATVQEATAPIRRSSQLSQLRRRAIWARCQAEMVAGVSGGKDGGKESRACSKMRELSG
jgi:hypothetical protein